MNSEGSTSETQTNNRERPQAIALALRQQIAHRPLVASAVLVRISAPQSLHVVFITLGAFS